MILGLAEHPTAARSPCSAALPARGDRRRLDRRDAKRGRRPRALVCAWPPRFIRSARYRRDARAVRPGRCRRTTHTEAFGRADPARALCRCACQQSEAARARRADRRDGRGGSSLLLGADERETGRDGRTILSATHYLEAADDLAVGHEHRPVGVGVGLLQVTSGKEIVPPVRGLLAHRAAKERRPSTAIATVGASSTSSSGLLTSATAKRTRWVCPPESFCVRCAPASARPAQLEDLVDIERIGTSEAAIATSSRTDRSRISAPVCSIAPIQPASIAALERRRARRPCDHRARPGRGSCRSWLTCRPRWTEQGDSPAGPSRRRCHHRFDLPIALRRSWTSIAFTGSS